MLSALEMKSSDVFLDLGSGRGALLFHAALNHTPPARCIGVELSQERHKIALAAHARFRGQGGGASTVELRCEDMRTTTLAGATVVYFMNQDLPRRLCAVMWDRFRALARGEFVLH